jgi:hypothetical protein
MILVRRGWRTSCAWSSADQLSRFGGTPGRFSGWYGSTWHDFHRSKCWRLLIFWMNYGP